VTLRERIEQEIRECGPIPFSRYMELCLYEPELGYYARHAGQFGKAGDFYTSSDVHAVFGRLLARQFDEMWRELGSPGQIEIVELGPGRGLFAQDVLDWSEKKFPAFFTALRYVLVEGSAALRSRLQQTLSRHVASGTCSVVDELATAFGKTELARRQGTVAPAETGGAASGQEDATVVFANEFFDALPVEVVSAQGSLRIDVHDHRMVETWVPSSAAELEFLDRYGVHPESGERVEVALAAYDYMSRIASAVGRGFLVAIDYGYVRGELLEGRHRGTVMTYRQHSASANPYEAPGEQDITAHVNFTALAAAAEQAGMPTHKLLTQSQFLMGIGEANQFGDAFEDCRQPQEIAKVALQLKHLVTPAGMGETFHVLVGSKGVSAEAIAGLSGLSFGKG
jgi:SAM-dependent MidA family methyltransferase